MIDVLAKKSFRSGGGLEENAGSCGLRGTLGCEEALSRWGVLSLTPLRLSPPGAARPNAFQRAFRGGGALPFGAAYVGAWIESWPPRLLSCFRPTKAARRFLSHSRLLYAALCDAAGGWRTPRKEVAPVRHVLGQPGGFLPPARLPPPPWHANPAVGGIAACEQCTWGGGACRGLLTSLWGAAVVPQRGRARGQGRAVNGSAVGNGALSPAVVPLSRRFPPARSPPQDGVRAAGERRAGVAGGPRVGAVPRGWGSRPVPGTSGLRPSCQPHRQAERRGAAPAVGAAAVRAARAFWRFSRAWSCGGAVSSGTSVRLRPEVGKGEVRGQENSLVFVFWKNNDNRKTANDLALFLCCFFFFSFKLTQHGKLL